VWYGVETRRGRNPGSKPGPDPEILYWKLKSFLTIVYPKRDLRQTCHVDGPGRTLAGAARAASGARRGAGQRCSRRAARRRRCQDQGAPRARRGSAGFRPRPASTGRFYSSRANVPRGQKPKRRSFDFACPRHLAINTHISGKSRLGSSLPPWHAFPGTSSTSTSSMPWKQRGSWARGCRC